MIGSGVIGSNAIPMEEFFRIVRNPDEYEQKLADYTIARNAAIEAQEAAAVAKREAQEAAEALAGREKSIANREGVLDAAGARLQDGQMQLEAERAAFAEEQRAQRDAIDQAEADLDAKTKQLAERQAALAEETAQLEATRERCAKDRVELDGLLSQVKAQQTEILEKFASVRAIIA